MKKIFGLMIAVVVLSGCKKQHGTWLALGDSITYLNEHQGETAYRIKKGYMTMVTERLPGLSYVNKGFNGWTAVHIAEKIDWLGLTTADIYTVFLGTNDWWAGNRIGTMKDFEGNTGTGTIHGSFRIILDKFKMLNPSAKVILITPMQRSDFVYINGYRNNAYGSYKEKDGQTLEQVADAVIAIGAHEHIRVVDLFHEKSLAIPDLVAFKHLKDTATGAYRNFPYPDYIGVPFNPDTDEYPYPPEAARMTFDGLHPSDAGYEVITKLLLEAMRK